MSFPEGSGFETAVYTASGKLVILPSGSVLATIDGRPVINPTLGSAARATVDALITAAHAMAPLGESRLSPEARERLRALCYVR